MSAITPIDLTRLPAPDAIEALDFESIFDEMRVHLISLDPDLESTLALESEPLTKLLQLAAYRELLLRQRVNDAVRATMLAYATGTDLDHYAARYNLERLTVIEADDTTTPVTVAVLEADADFRLRIQLALDGLSTAGPERAYIFHALSANARVLDASVDAPKFDALELTPAQLAVLPANASYFTVGYDADLSQPIPGDVVITVLARDNNGTPDAELLATVESALNADGVRPLTDNITVRPAEIVSFDIDATVFTYDGPDTSLVLASGREQLDAYLEENNRLGYDITLSGIYAALHVAGVQRIELVSPLNNVVCSPAQAAAVNNLTITHGGLDQ